MTIEFRRRSVPRQARLSDWPDVLDALTIRGADLTEKIATTGAATPVVAKPVLDSSGTLQGKSDEQKPRSPRHRGRARTTKK